MTESIRSIDKYGDQIWKLPNGKIHRVDGPAVIYPNGHQEWWVNNVRHRLDGPAIVRANGHQRWYIHGVNVTDQVTAWMTENNIGWPFDADTHMEFIMRFV